MKRVALHSAKISRARSLSLWERARPTLLASVPRAAGVPALRRRHRSFPGSARERYARQALPAVMDARRNRGRFSPAARSRAEPGNEVARARAGVSLIEMMVVMSVAAVMVGMAVTTIHLLLGAEHDATKAVRWSASVSRLARSFRDDVHAARSIEMPAPEPGKPAVLVATTDTRRIRYELDAHRAVRIEAEGTDESHCDVYYFPPRSRLEFTRPGDRGLVRLTIHMPAGAREATRSAGDSSREVEQELAIEAVLLHAPETAETSAGRRR